MTIFPSLRHRIATIFVGLLSLIMVLILVLVSHSNTQVVTSEVERELTAGAHIFERLLEQNKRQLETTVTVLTADFGFRAAIATQDRPTILSVLRNHGARIGAKVMMVIGPDGKLIADTQGLEVGRSFPFPDLIATAETQGRSSGFKQMDNRHLYQLVLVPILAPSRIAWVAMGFPVDDAWARELASMTGLEVSVVRGQGAHIEALASSLSAEQRNRLPRALWAVPSKNSISLSMGDERFQTQLRPLDRNVSVVLQRSLEQAEAPFLILQNRLALIVAGGIAFFALGSIMLARHIAGPVKALAAFARLIEKGNYEHSAPKLPPDELGQLSDSLDHMREGIAAREHKIRKLAYEDELTGLPNRTQLLEAFEQLEAQSGAVLVLDLDRFAMINDALGHPVGDRLLVEVGERLQRQVLEGDLLARLWGDEFAFLLAGDDESETQAFAEKVLAALRDPIPLDNQRVDVSGSLGIALYPRDGQDATTLLRRAELAMYRAKQRQSGFAFATGDDGDPPSDQLSLLGEMREALEHNEFVVYYQPKLFLSSNQVMGAEALIRWRHPTRGLVPPLQFIPFAEQTGFIREITPWLLETVASHAAEWRAKGVDLVLSVNLSTRDLLNPGLVKLTKQLLELHALPPQTLCMEITESALMEDPELAQLHLAQLSALGIKLSIDDYGVGQASLAYLKTLPVNELKIDQTFVRSLQDTPKDAAIVRSTIALGHALGLSVVAEGAETMADVEWLGAANCDIVQGYALAKPMPAEDLADWLTARVAQALDTRAR